jgi:hypothetical protein
MKTLYDGTRGLTDRGTLVVEVRDETPRREIVRAGQPISAKLTLQPGWNSVKLSLDTGNIQASTLFPGSGDQRWLSFKLEQLDILTN